MRLVVGLALLACGDAPPPPAPDPLATPADAPAFARGEVWRSLAADLAAPRHPGDGGGSVQIVEGPLQVTAGGFGSWTFALTVGPEGIAVGGAVLFHSPPFWGWSPAQVDNPMAPGLVTVEGPTGASLTAEVVDSGVVRARVGGRPLRAGEVVTVRYGAGEPGARVDRYTERAEPFWFGVDADGDGVRELLAPPTVRVDPGPPVGVVVHLPTTARPGDTARITVALLDAWANRADVDGEVTLTAPAALGLPDRLPIRRGVGAVDAVAREGGMYRVAASWKDDLGGISEPILVHPDAPPVLWADLQVHTTVSDGSGDLDDVYAYARDVAGLDAVAITDHDHWGMRFLDRTPALWEAERAAAEAAYQPGRFVTFPAFEWTSWLYGHRHVLYVGAPGPVIGSVDAATRHPTGLWAALAPYDAITIAHHSAGGPIGVDWRIAPDPRLEPVTEVCSVHGSSEAPDTPFPIYDPIAGNTVREAALARGYRLGFLCSTDGHDGHPGLAHLQAASGGLAGLFTADRTREGVAAALRARRAFGTSGQRFLVRTWVNGVEMGGTVPADDQPESMEVRVVAGERVERIEIVRGQSVPEQRFPAFDVVREQFTLPPLAPGEWVYARVRLVSGATAWTSPVWAE